MKISTFKKLLLYALAVFAVKLIAIPFLQGVFILPDEGCMMAVPEYLANYGKLANCSDVISTGGGNPPRLTSLLLAPIFFFFDKYAAYYAILIYHALFGALMAFPLYHIFKHYIKKESTVFLYTTAVLFIPQILTYQLAIFSETYFIFFGICFLYFYIKSFKGKTAKRNKIISYILALLGVGLRPFGFIILLSMVVNESLRIKKKTKVIAILIAALGIVSLYVGIAYPGIYEALYLKINMLNSPQGLYALFHSFIGQVNSYTLSTLIIPFYLVLSQTFAKKPIHKDIRIFLITIIGLNFIIATQHMFGYFTKDVTNTFIITRYINLTAIYIIIFSFIFLEKLKTLVPTGKDILVFAFILLCFFGINATNLNLQLSHDLSYLYYTDKTVFFTCYVKIIFIFLFALIFLNHKKTLQLVIVPTFITIGIISAMTITQFSRTVNDYKPIFDFFADKEGTVLFLMDQEKDMLELSYWQTVLYTDNDVDSLFYDRDRPLGPNGKTLIYGVRPKLKQLERTAVNFQLGQYDYIATPLEPHEMLDMEQVFQFAWVKIYKPIK